jgi:hypothetical protein
LDIFICKEKLTIGRLTTLQFERHGGAATAAPNIPIQISGSRVDHLSDLFYAAASLNPVNKLTTMF